MFLTLLNLCHFLGYMCFVVWSVVCIWSVLCVYCFMTESNQINQGNFIILSNSQRKSSLWCNFIEFTVLILISSSGLRDASDSQWVISRCDAAGADQMTAVLDLNSTTLVIYWHLISEKIYCDCLLLLKLRLTVFSGERSSTHFLLLKIKSLPVLSHLQISQSTWETLQHCAVYFSFYK